MRGDLKKGDYVRLTFEGWVAANHGKTVALASKLNSEIGEFPLYLIFGNDNPAVKIELIEQPIKIGDVVFDPLSGSSATVVGEVIRNGSRLLWLDGGDSGFRTRREAVLTTAFEGRK